MREIHTPDGVVITERVTKCGSTPHRTSEFRIEPKGGRPVPQATLNALTADIERFKHRPKPPAGRPTRAPQTLYQWPDATVHPKVHVQLNALTPEQMLTDPQKALLNLIRRTPRYQPNKKLQH